MEKQEGSGQQGGQGEGTLLSIQVGKAQRRTMPAGVRVDFRNEVWTSGIFKGPVGGERVRVTRTGIAGDEQADLENHGGPDNVVLAYDADHYEVWRERLEMPELAYGSFGENFTVRGFTDESVCIGDVWQVGAGDAGPLLQVTQPRQPCYKLARRLQQPHIVKMVHDNSWGGWYLRVLREGEAQAGMKILRVERPHPEWPVATAVQTMYARNKDELKARALAELPALSRRWKEELVGM